MLEDAIEACPDGLWSASLWDDPDDPRYGQFWRVAYHTLYWLDLDLHGSREGFAPPAPFKRTGFPDQPYTKEELLNYLRQCRQNCQAIILGLTDEKANALCKFEWMEPSYVELQLYCMRHIQEHAAHLSMWLGQHGISGPDWVAVARNKK